MSNNFIPQMEPWFDELEREAINKYMGQATWLTEFRETSDFEKMLCEYTHSQYAIAVNNGTLSLSLAMYALGIGPGDEVIVPNLTMIATPNSVGFIGAKPVFADVESNTLCLDLNEVQKKLTKRTKAIIHVSYNGRSNDLYAFKKFCAENNLILIEDAAQSLGSFYKNKHLGTIGDVGSVSFSAPKIISTGQGGALFAQNKNIFEKLKRAKDFGRSSGGNDIHDELGINCKFTDLQGVIGKVQMGKLAWRIQRKKDMFALYYKRLKNISNIEFIATDISQTTPWFIDIFTDKRNELSQFLKQKNIGTRICYPPIHSQKCYQINEDFPVTQYFAQRGLWLPSASQLTDQEIHFICDQIEAFYKG